MYIDFTICSEENKLIFLKELFPNSTLLMKDDLLISGKKIPYNEFNITFELDFFYYIDDMIRSFKNFINNEKNFCVILFKQTI